jgi:hypothetical protein
VDLELAQKDDDVVDGLVVWLVFFVVFFVEFLMVLEQLRL